MTGRHMYDWYTHTWTNILLYSMITINIIITYANSKAIKPNKNADIEKHCPLLITNAVSHKNIHSCSSLVQPPNICETVAAKGILCLYIPKNQTVGSKCIVSAHNALQKGKVTKCWTLLLLS